MIDGETERKQSILKMLLFVHTPLENPSDGIVHYRFCALWTTVRSELCGPLTAVPITGYNSFNF